MSNKSLVQQVNNCIVVECDNLNQSMLLTETASSLLKSCKFDKSCAIILAFASGNYSAWCKMKGYKMDKNSIEWILKEIYLNPEDSNLATLANILDFYNGHTINIFKFVKVN